MKRSSTIFLKVAVILMGVPILALSTYGLPWFIKNPVNPEYAHILYPLVGIMYVSAVPFFITLYQAFLLLSYIDKSQAFSEISVKSLKTIKKCAITISGLYVVGMPIFYVLAEKDDAPGVILIGLIIIFASMVIAVFAAVLQKLLQEAIDMKSENNLTV